MRHPLPIDPVVIMLDAVDTGDTLRFSGVDLEDGSRVSVLIERRPLPLANAETRRTPAPHLLLVLSIEGLDRPN